MNAHLRQETQSVLNLAMDADSCRESFGLSGKCETGQETRAEDTSDEEVRPYLVEDSDEDQCLKTSTTDHPICT